MEHLHIIMVRALGAIVVMFIFTRILGKRQISQLTFFEYITGITIGDLAGFISTDIEANYIHGLGAMVVWFIIPFSVEWLVLKNRRLRFSFEGKERALIKEGKIMEGNLKKERVSSDELLEQLRTKNVFNLTEVEYAVFESSGALSVLLKSENRPLTPKDLKMKVASERAPLAIIMDSEIIDEGLEGSGYTREWLQTELETLGLTNEDVYLAQLDAYGQMYVDFYDDRLSVPVPKTKALLYATLQKAHVDLELFAATTKNMNARNRYIKCAEEMEAVVQSLKMILSN